MLTLKKEILFIIILYSFAYGLMLLNAGLFWDDWALYGEKKDIIITRFRQAGDTPTGYFHSFLYSLKEATLIYRVIVFLSYLLAGLFLNSVLWSIKGIDDVSRFFITLFFVLFPVNSSRISTICSPYAISYFLFFLGFWLTSRYVSRKRLLLRIIILSIFFTSFLTNSILVFYSIVLSYLAYLERRNVHSMSTFFKLVSKYTDFILLPIVFWCFRALYLMPYGLYAGYNDLNLNLPVIFKDIILAFHTSFVDVLVTSLNLFSVPILLLALLVTCILPVIFTQKTNNSGVNKHDLWLLVFGVFSFVVAIFPYLAVGKIPYPGDWANRHQLLVPLGASFMLYYGVKIPLDWLKINPSFKMFLYSVIILLFINYNIVTYLSFQEDWFKQYSLIENFRSSEILRNHTTFLFRDNAPDLNANGRQYRSYEFAGLMNYALGGEKRFGCVIQRCTMERRELMDIYRTVGYTSFPYPLIHYYPREPEYEVVIRHSDYDMTLVNTLNLMFLEYSDSERFKVEVKNILELEYVKLT